MIDLRSRVDGDAQHLGVHDAMDALASGFADLTDRYVANGSLRPLVLDVAGRGWCLAVTPRGPTVEPVEAWGDQAVVHISATMLSELVADQTTPIAWLASGVLKEERAGLALLLDWWLLVRAALDGTIPHRPGAIDFTDRSGQPLDLARSFTLEDPPEDRAHFLAQAGFLHLKGVFSPEEMAEISADMDRLAPTYSLGDGRSWWATLEDGTDALVRMQGLEAGSAATARLLADPRFLGLCDLTGDGHQPATGNNRIEGLFKPLGVSQGISDIPWHKDCSLGRHSYECCAITVGVSVTGADAHSGQLRVVAGSNRALMWPAPSIQPGNDLPVIDLPTRTGDLTLHCSCTLHMAQPPVTEPRRVLYTSLFLPLDPAAAAAARARRSAVREAAPVTVSQPATR